jgi:primosomal protein N' (replication factor Y)
MYLLKVIPATKIPLPSPQILTYFSAREIPKGGLVFVPIHKRQAIGVVIDSKKLNSQKMDIRKADFELRPIKKIVSPEPFLNEKQIDFAIWMSEYYYCAIGPVIKTMLPPKAQRLKLSAQNDDSASKSGQTLIVFPEISMAEEIMQQRDNKETAIIHSSLIDRQYLENWHKIRDGSAKKIIGTRLALFAPFDSLKEIIIKDEHNELYKSRQTPRYHTRESALKLAEVWNAKIIFESATPSIETSWLAEKKKIILEKPADNRQPLSAKIIDLRDELKNKNFSIFSRELQKRIESALVQDNQIILFINRRGSSTVLMCRDCGHIPKCPNCEVPLVYHLSPIKFLCHHCSHSEIPPVLCPQCLGTRIKFFGAGTQKVEMELQKIFPNAKTARLDSDIVKNPKEESNIIDSFREKKLQILIGTQMLFNKHIPRTPIVAMILADTLLHLPDFRSNERTYQLISQLKNLASENFILQTYSPENPAIVSAVNNDYNSFYKEEIETRKILSYPPFSQLIKLVYAHQSPKRAEDEAKILSEKLKQQVKIFSKELTGINKKTEAVNLQPFAILGPSSAFISKVSGRYIWQIIIKSKISDCKLRNKILQIIPRGWIVDADPLQII